jgi:hypothetical protein
MKAVAERTQTETAQIKALLPPVQQQQPFDQVYGPEGVLPFSYPKPLVLEEIG